MSAKYLGLQPVAMGVLDGTASPAAFVGEAIGFGTVTDSGTGDWTIAVDADVGLPASSAVGCFDIACNPLQRALAAGTVVVPLIVSATALDVNAWDLATPSPVDCIVSIVISRWPG